jgi:Ca2+-binding EF-hand superfamily protein
MPVRHRRRAARLRQALGGAALLAAGAWMPGMSVAAEPVPDAPPDGFQAADLDGSGSIDRREYFSYVASQFMAYDINDDGRLSREELTHPRDAGRFEHADADGDGHCSLDEVVDWANGDFSGLDANNNGMLERSETES